MSKDKILAYADKVFSNDEGKVVLKHIKEEICRYEKTTLSYDVNKSLDTNAMAYNEGRRVVWNEIKKLLKDTILLDIEKLKLKGEQNV